MKITLTIMVLLMMMLAAFAQKNTRQNTLKASHTKNTDITDLDTLTQELMASVTNEKEKLETIFRWVAENISYNTNIFKRYGREPLDAMLHEEPDDTSALKSLNERVAIKVLKRKVAVCDGYTRLFKVLCDRAGIPNEIIPGYARTNFGNNRNRFMTNHTWNAVFIDGKWQLTDVTWASGFISYSEDFIRHFDEYYFLTPPQQFIRDHYPEDPQWTLITDPPLFREFYDSPYRYGSFLKSGITFFSPAKGIIEADIGDSIIFELKTKNPGKKILVTQELLSDSALVFYMTANENSDNTHFRFNYTVPDTDKAWLYVYVNEELVMRYKLNLKKTGAAFAKKPGDANPER